MYNCSFLICTDLIHVNVDATFNGNLIFLNCFGDIIQRMKQSIGFLFFAFLYLNPFGFSQVLESYDHNGTQRFYTYYIPSSWNSNQQVPLLIVLHGLTQTGSGVMDITGFNDIAETNNFIVCYPNGLNASWNANMNVSVSSADDKGFLEELAVHFQNDFNTDPSRQYLCGFSTGGFMSHKMVCESTECFAAIATVSGNMSDTVYQNCMPHGSPSVLHIHGTGDAIVPYSGGPATGVSVDETMNFWKGHLACDPDPVITPMANPNLLDLSSPERWVWQNCDQQELELIHVINGGHQWPGITTFVGGVGTINMDFYSPEEIWNFLSDKSCEELSISSSDKIETEVYPNPTSEDVTVTFNKPVNELRFYDLKGRIYYEVNDPHSGFTFSMSELEAGIYFVQLVLDEKSIVKKVIKE